MATETIPKSENTERMFARGFTVLGGIFWIVTAFAGEFMYGAKTIPGAFGVAIYPLIFTISVLGIGWFYERIVSMLLALGAIGTVAWGLIQGTWEPSVWAIMLIFFVAPTVVAAVLFFLAGTQAQRHDGAHTASLT